MTEKNDHYIRQATFSVEVCPQPMWGLFEKRAKLDTRPGTPFTDLDSYLAYHQPLAKQMLKRHFINLKQFGLIYTATHVDITKWDVTLAATMLHNFFKSLPAIEQSHIDDIRQVRNDLHHISGSAEVDEPTFLRHWSTLRQSTLGLASLVSSECNDTIIDYIDTLRYKPLPAPGGVLEVLKEWFLLDQERDTNVQNVLAATTGAINILNDTIVRTTNQTDAALKRMKVMDHVWENMKEQSTIYIGHLQQRYKEHEQFEAAKRMFQQHKAIVLIGPPASRSDILAANLMTACQSDQCVVLHRPSEWIQIKLSEVSVVHITEFTGKFNFDKSLSTKWLTHFDIILAAVKEGKLNVIITSRQEFLDRCLKEISNHELLQHVLPLTVPYTVDQMVKIEPGTSTDDDDLLHHVLPLTAPYTADQMVKIEPGTSTDDDDLLHHVLPLTAPYTADQMVKIEPGISTDDDADQNDHVDPHHDEPPVQFVGRYTIQLKDGGTWHGIGRLCPVSRDVFLMSRLGSRSLYRLNSSYHEIDHLDMDGDIVHIVRMNDHQAAVNTYSGSNTIQVVSLEDVMRVVNKITTTVDILSFDFQNDKFFILCSRSDNTIHVYNVRGSRLNTIPCNVGNYELNKSILSKKIAVRNDRLVISFNSSKDEYTCIVCLNMNGDQMWRRNITTYLLYISPFIIDDNGNVIVSDGKQIIKVSQCGQQQSTIIDLGQFRFTEAYLSISRPLSRLYVTDFDNDDIIVCKLVYV